MTKEEIKVIAKSVKCMDILNTISGLMEINNPADKYFINQLIDDVHKIVNSTEKPTKSITKAQMLNYIKDHDIDSYNKLKNKRFLEIRWEYNKLTKGE